ncbi:MAG: proline--tRNA ligase [bacterium]|nr:proline--tRNA ligase [bacterium]
MRYTKSFIYTLKETPADTTTLSHSLLTRACYIYQHAAGIYNFLPLGFKVLSKIWKIIEEEMDKIGAQELLMPALHTSNLWLKTNRYNTMDNVLFKFKDKKGVDMLLGPTHEEIITDIVAHFVKSYKNLPLLLYQIQVKFRDELRPKGGLIRGREFIMKDLYSFHTSLECLDKTYNNVYKAYSNIFERLNLPFEVVEAHSGAIGGDVSHEFMLITNSGEDKFIKCLSCGYTASTEIAKIAKPDFNYSYNPLPLNELEQKHLVHTPNAYTIQDLVKFLNKNEKNFVKSILYKDNNNNFYLVLVRGDKEINEIKLNKFLDKEVFLAENKDFEINNWILGYIGPVNLNNRSKVKIIADYSVSNLKDIIIGANKKDYHFINLNLENLDIDDFGDLSIATDNDECYKCKGKYKVYPALELGHIFKLGTKYSQALGAYFMDETNKLKPIIMGCYGIGVSRLVSAIVEAYSSENSITWTFNSTPYKIYILTINIDDKLQYEKSLNLYNTLIQNNIETLWDDRKESAGVKFKDWELLGIPFVIIIGNKIKDNLIELKFNPNFHKTLKPELFEKITNYQNSLINYDKTLETIQYIINLLNININFIKN